MKKIKLLTFLGYEIFIEVPEHLTEADIAQIVSLLDKKIFKKHS